MHHYLEYNARGVSDQGRLTLECSAELYNKFFSFGGGAMWPQITELLSISVAEGRILFHLMAA